MSDEPILSPGKRLSLFPIQYEGVWQRYLTARSALWLPAEIDLSADLEHWKQLTENERNFLSYTLAFFAQADGIVADNLVERFINEIQVREIQVFYSFQSFMENVHNETYSLLLETLITDTDERARLLNAAEHVASVRDKAQWAMKWLSSERSFATRLLAFATVEGIFFSGSFASIFWIKQRGVLPGVCMSNTLIARDEGLHQEFATYMYRELLNEKLPHCVVYELIDEAVALETAFIVEALPCALIGINSDSMSEYIRFVADRLLTEVQVPPRYNAKNPFVFMEAIGMEGKTNFFENRNPDYRLSTGTNAEGRYDFDLDSEF